MTRINCVPPSELTDKHLLAEYRELPRVFGLARCGDDIPTSYRMGAGHVKFFYDKLGYLKRRQKSLIDECIQRGFNIKHTSVDFAAPDCLCGDWIPSEADMAINRARIKERLS